MRRTDREVTDFNEILTIIHGCQVCRLALNTEDWPYILPVNFGMEVRDGQMTLYFHGAAEGTKYALMERDPRASFEMDRETALCSNRDTGNCAMCYESVIGQGRLSIITDEEERIHGLDVLTAHYHPEGFAYNRAMLPSTVVYQLKVDHLTAKRRPRT